MEIIEDNRPVNMLNFQDLAKITVEAIHENKEDVGILQGYGGEKSKAKTKKELRSEQVKEHVSDLIDNSSLHGLSYIFDKRHPIRRVIWFFITVAAFVYSMLKVYESTVNHFSYPFNTARMREYVDEIEFPAVSFCNINDMRMSVLNGTAVDKAIVTYQPANVSAEEYRRVTRSAAHDISEMLVNCEFNGRKCSKDNFTTFNWKQGDRCFTFNSGSPGHPILKVKGTGIERSLTLTINVQHNEYYRDSMVSGIHLMLHGQDETPVRIRGPMLSPGYTTYIQVEKKKILNLKAPYKTNCGSLDLKYFKGYSMHTCWLEQLTDYVEAKCRCKDFFMPGNISICNLDTAFRCMWPKWEEFDKGKLYKCPLPCEIDSYHVDSISRALFPSEAYSKVLKKQLQDEPHMKKTVIDDPKQFMRDNLLRVVIYYNDLSYERLEQQASYDTLVWLGDVGGQIGLFIGAGAMSYFEFIDCIALVIYARFFQSFKSETPNV